MQHPTVLEHSDQVSGTTILVDGTKVYWSEGRSSWVYVLYPDGRRESMPCAHQHPIIEAIMRIAEEGAETYRNMTEDEEIEHSQADR